MLQHFTSHRWIRPISKELDNCPKHQHTVFMQQPIVMPRQGEEQSGEAELAGAFSHPECLRETKIITKSPGG